MSSPICYCGVDLAKHHFSNHAIDSNGKVILHKSVSRSKLLSTIAKLPVSRIGLEACSGKHYWAREFNKLGHDAHIMAAKNARIIWPLLHHQTEYQDFIA